MIVRKVQQEIEDSLKNFPVAGILGPRQVGKTTLAKCIMDKADKGVLYLDLELPSDQNKLLDAELYLSSHSNSLVIIDEIQRMPSLFPVLRALVDQNRTAGRFLLLGSASPDLIRHSSESLAGRIVYHELSPLTLIETAIEDPRLLWYRGGYPDSYLADNEGASAKWREAFIKTYLEMDIPQLGIRVPSAQLRRFWTMIAHMHGQLWNASRIAGSLGVSAPTVRHYLDILSETFIVRQLQPFHANLKKRLVKSPKIYIRDSGLLHSLIKPGSFDDLQAHPVVGSSWEGFVIEQILAILPPSWSYFFYRTSAGAEIDLLLLDGQNRPIAVEIKYSLSPRVTIGFWNAYEDLLCIKGYVVYPGSESYPVGEGVSTLPLKDLRKIVSK